MRGRARSRTARADLERDLGGRGCEPDATGWRAPPQPGVAASIYRALRISHRRNGQPLDLCTQLALTVSSVRYRAVTRISLERCPGRWAALGLCLAEPNAGLQGAVASSRGEIHTVQSDCWKLSFDVEGQRSEEPELLRFDPLELWPAPTSSLERPRFIAIVADRGRARRATELLVEDAAPARARGRAALRTGPAWRVSPCRSACRSASAPNAGTSHGAVRRSG